VVSVVQAVFLAERLILLRTEGNVSDEKLNALLAELQAIEFCDAGETPANEGEIEARRIRRLEILSEINLLKRIESLRSAEKNFPF
jgi:hypothetical protein